MEKGPAGPHFGCSAVRGSAFLGLRRQAGEVEASPTVTVQVDAAEKAPIQRKVVTDAVLYPRDQAAIVPKVASSVKKWYVDKGSHVKAGQLLGELENSDLAGAAQKSQGGLTQAEATYQMQLQKSAQDLKFAKQSLDSAQKFYDGRAALYKEGAVSAKDLDDANVALSSGQEHLRPDPETIRPEGCRRRIERRQRRHRPTPTRRWATRRSSAQSTAWSPIVPTTPVKLPPPVRR